MKILVINAGSSSLKYQLMDMETENCLAKGICERIGFGGYISHKTADARRYELEKEIKDHKSAFNMVASLLTDKEYGVVEKFSDIKAVGHRIVQGAEIFKTAAIVSEKVLKDIESLSSLAPLHNHAQAEAIRASIEAFGKDIIQAVVFDTSFHQTIEEKAFLYAIPYELYKKYGIRKYGFHGTSHRYVSLRVAKILGRDLNEIKLVSCHLGNGSSITAIKNGKSVDTTMGLTPLDGLLMGTRCGNIDPSCLIFLMEKESLSPKEMSFILNEKSGLLGVSGISSDYRDVKKAADQGNKRAKLVIDMLSYQIRKKIASAAAAMNGVDAVVFTGGIGENSSDLTISVCSGLEFLGAQLDEKKCEEMVGGKEGIISKKTSNIDLLVVPTNEELLIAKDVEALVEC